MASVVSSLVLLCGFAFFFEEKGNSEILVQVFKFVLIFYNASCYSAMMLWVIKRVLSDLFVPMIAPRGDFKQSATDIFSFAFTLS